MNYSKYIKGPFIAYLFSGILFAFILAGYIYLSQYHQKTMKLHRTLQEIRQKSYLINNEVQRMQKEIRTIQAFIKDRQDPEEAIFQRIAMMEGMGLKVSVEGLKGDGSALSMPINIEFYSKDLGSAIRTLRAIISDRPPLLLIERFKISTDRQGTVLKVNIKAKLVAFEGGKGHEGNS